MKQAVLIVAYKNFGHLESVINTFDEDFEVYIHIDKKVKLPLDVYQRLKSYPWVKVLIQRYRVCWGGLNHVKATLLLCREALKSQEVGYLHLISGVDYPVKHLFYFKTFFQQNQHTEFMEYFSLPTPRWVGGGLERLIYFYPYDWINVRTGRNAYWIKKILDWQKKWHIKRKFSFQEKLYGGSTWWSLSRKCVAYIVAYSRTNPHLLRRLRATFAADEIYFQTVVMNSAFASHVANNNLRYIVWKYRNGHMPANLDVTDLKSILVSDKLFARKIEYPIASTLMERLQNIHQDYLSFRLETEISVSKVVLPQLAEYLYLKSSYWPFDDLFYGKTGIAIFLFHYARFSGKKKYVEKGYDLLDEVLENISRIKTFAEVEFIPGVLIALKHLHQHNFIPESIKGILDEIHEKVIGQFPQDKLSLHKEWLSRYMQVKNQQEDRFLENFRRWEKRGFSKSGNYVQQIHLSRGLGLLGGYAGIGLELLGEITP